METKKIALTQDQIQRIMNACNTFAVTCDQRRTEASDEGNLRLAHYLSEEAEAYHELTQIFDLLYQAR